MHDSAPHFPTDRLESAPPARGGVAVRVASKAAVAESAEAATVFRLSRRTQSLTGVQVVGCGSYVPERVVTNAELEQRYGFEPGWVEQRTGIRERRYAAAGQATSDLCAEAARSAIRAAGVTAADVDLVVVGTFTPDHLSCPSTACLVQNQLGIDGPAFDVQAACSGFVYALTTAAQYVATGNSRLALVLGADVNSRIVDPWDQRTAPLFGDGAGAVLLARGSSEQGLVCYQMGSDGSGGPLLEIRGGGTRKPFEAGSLEAGDQYLRMDGRNVFKWAVRAVAETIQLLLETTGMSPRDVALYVLHQANIRIINHAMEQLGIPEGKVYNNLQRYGNTSAGSIPIALDEAWRGERFGRGDTLLLSGFGAGLTWGTALLRW